MLTDAHERGLITNVTHGTYDFPAGSGLVVTCLFRRNKTANLPHDGMPLMYALKGTNAYTMPIADVRRLYRRGALLFDGRFGRSEFDVVIPVPSSSGVPERMATLVARHMEPRAVVYDILRKRKVQAVLRDAPDGNSVPQRDRPAYKAAVSLLRKSDPNLTFSMKKVSASLRTYFRTVDIAPNARIPHSKRILFVDDSAQTGSSMRESANLISQYFRPEMIHGLVIVGP